MNDDLGERMKLYERIECDRILIPRLPIYARIDGRCFSNFTRNMKRPYDEAMTRGMIEATRYLVEETHAIIGYTQSDEISLAWYFPEPKSEPLFGGKLHKLTSILAALATAKFNHDMRAYIRDAFPVFDCRVFNLPNLDEAANAFLWRELDATKNAVSMAASAYFSPKQLHGKSGKEKQEMLFQHHGINFNDYPAFFKRGTFVRRVTE
jgi:tRNA(His) guanylyltransferase